MDKEQGKTKAGSDAETAQLGSFSPFYTCVINAGSMWVYVAGNTKKVSRSELVPCIFRMTKRSWIECRLYCSLEDIVKITSCTKMVNKVDLKGIDPDLPVYHIEVEPDYMHQYSGQIFQ